MAKPKQVVDRVVDKKNPEKVVAYGVKDGGKRVEVDKRVMSKQVSTNEQQYFTEGGGKKATVQAVSPNTRQAHVRTPADGTKKDNLSNLPTKVRK